MSFVGACGGPDPKHPIALFAITASPVDSFAVIITWTTNINSTATVEYGLTSTYGDSNVLLGLMTNHAVSLTGLTRGTLYHYRVISSADGDTNTATSSDYSFVTPSGDSSGVTLDAGSAP